jgi:hypothetical protein
LKAFFGDRYGAELFEMRIGKLRIEQGIAARFQSRRQMHQRDLARISHAREFAFGKKRRAKRQTVESADQLAPMPGFDTVGETAPVQGFKHVDDEIVDPGFVPVWLGLRTAADDLIESGIDGDVIAVRTNGAGQAARHVEFFQRKNAAFVWPDPKHLFGGAAFRHGKNTQPVGEQ